MSRVARRRSPYRSTCGGRGGGRPPSSRSGSRLALVAPAGIRWRAWKRRRSTSSTSAGRPARASSAWIGDPVGRGGATRSASSTVSTSRTWSGASPSCPRPPRGRHARRDDRVPLSSAPPHAPSQRAGRSRRSSPARAPAALANGRAHAGSGEDDARPASSTASTARATPAQKPRGATRTSRRTPISRPRTCEPAPASSKSATASSHSTLVTRRRSRADIPVGPPLWDSSSEVLGYPQPAITSGTDLDAHETPTGSVRRPLRSTRPPAGACGRHGPGCRQ